VHFYRRAGVERRESHPPNPRIAFSAVVVRGTQQAGEHCECFASRTAARPHGGNASAVFAEQETLHPLREPYLSCGRSQKTPAEPHWNLFVHSFSHPASKFLYLMDSDIVFNRRERCSIMYAAL